MTVAAALREARRRLAGAPLVVAGGSPDLDAEVLLRHTLGVSRAGLYTHPGRDLTPQERAALDGLLERRLSGEPVAYLTGTREFMGLPFAVDRRVLIPRPETELLVERALRALQAGRAADGSGAGARVPLRAVDVGTGSGAVAVSLAALAPAPWALRVVAADTSAGALEVARRNAAALVPADRPAVSFVRGSLLAPFRGPFDLVLANLPYVPSDEIPRLAPGVARFEPRGALDGGPDGLDVYRLLLRDLRARLRPGAKVLLECDPRQSGALRRLLRDALPGAPVDVLPDLAGRDRLVEATC